MINFSRLLVSCGSPGSSHWLFWNVCGNKNRLRETSCLQSPGNKYGAEVSDSTSANSETTSEGCVFNSASQQPVFTEIDGQAAEVGEPN